MRPILALVMVACTGTSVQTLDVVRVDEGLDVQTLDVVRVDEGLDVQTLDVVRVDEGLDVQTLDVVRVDEGLDVVRVDEGLDVQTLDVVRIPDACATCSLGISACYWTDSMVQCCGSPWPVACPGVGCHAFPCPDR